MYKLLDFKGFVDFKVFFGSIIFASMKGFKFCEGTFTNSHPNNFDFQSVLLFRQNFYF